MKVLKILQNRLVHCHLFIAVTVIATLLTAMMPGFLGTSGYVSGSVLDSTSAPMPATDPYKIVTAGNIITGTIDDYGDISVSPSSIDFDPVQVGSSSSPKTVIIRNEGGSAGLIIDAITITGPDTGQFSIVSDNASLKTLAAGASANVSISFKPTTVSARSASLSIPSSDPYESTVTVPLSGTGTPGNDADISVSPSSIDFGPVQSGSSSSPKTVIISNEGLADLIIDTITLTGASPGQFSIVSDNASLKTLATGASANVSVSFKPTTVGAKSASLSIPSNDPGESTVTVPLSGTGTANDEADISVSPSSIDFGPVQSGSSSSPKTVIISNEGLADLIINAITLTGTDTGQFSIVSDNASLKTLATGASANVSVSFKPTSTGAKSASLSIPSNDPDESTVTVPLSGTGTPGDDADISVSPSSIDFGPVQSGSSSSPKTVIISNEGLADLIIGTITLTGTSPGQFSIVSDNASLKTLATGASANVSVSFKPTSTGAKSASLSIPSNDPDESTVTVPLSGTGTPGDDADISVSPSSIDFGPVQVGSSSSPKTVIISNEGGSAGLIIDAITLTGPDTGQFSIVSDNASLKTLATGASANVSVSFKPTSVGARSASLSIPSNDPDESTVTVPLSGTGTPGDDADISVSPSSIDFGPVQSGSSSSPKTVIISNEGLADLIIDTITLTGASPGQFSIVSDNASLKTIATGASANVSVSFKPTSVGARSASLSISSNDPDESTVTVPLSGTGTAPAPIAKILYYDYDGNGIQIPPPKLPKKYFTVDFLGKITMEPISESGRLLNSIKAYSPDGKHVFEMSEGTLTQDKEGNVVTLLKIREAAKVPVLPINTDLVGNAYDFTPSGIIFDKPVRLTLGYNIDQLPEQVASIALACHTIDLGWFDLPAEPGLVAELGKISAPINHFTTFAILARLSPPAFKLSNLSITPSVWELPWLVKRVGETATIAFVVVNRGGEEGTYTAILNVNGKVEESRVISLKPGQTQNAVFTIYGNEPGNYLIEIDDLSGELQSLLWINWLLILGVCVILGLLIWLTLRLRNRSKAAPDNDT